MASKLKHPERVVGFHFFNPVAILPLLEIVRVSRRTTPARHGVRCRQEAEEDRRCRSRTLPAFVVNRILTRFMGEIQNVIDEGTPVDVAEKAVEPSACRCPRWSCWSWSAPRSACTSRRPSTGPSRSASRSPRTLKAVVEAGKRGFYVYDSGKPELDPEVAALLKQGDSVPTEEQVRDRVLDAVAQEIGLMLDEGVVAEAQDIDLCLITGAGWPFHLGGITPYPDRARRRAGEREAVPGGGRGFGSGLSSSDSRRAVQGETLYGPSAVGSGTCTAQRRPASTSHR